MTGTTATDTAQRVRSFRQHYGLNQAELAGLLDVTRQTVTNWERGYPMSRLARYALLHLDRQLAKRETCPECGLTDDQHTRGCTVGYATYLGI